MVKNKFQNQIDRSALKKCLHQAYTYGGGRTLMLENEDNNILKLNKLSFLQDSKQPKTTCPKLFRLFSLNSDKKRTNNSRLASC